MNPIRVVLISGEDTLSLEKADESVYTFNGREITKEESDEILAEWRVTGREIRLTS